MDKLLSEIINAPEVAQVFYCVLSEEYNYGRAIAEKLDKTAPAIDFHLKKLIKVGLLTSEKQKLLNRTIYSVNFKILANIMFMMFYEPNWVTFPKDWKEDPMDVNALEEKTYQNILKTKIMRNILNEFASKIISTNTSISEFVLLIINSFSTKFKSISDILHSKSKEDIELFEEFSFICARVRVPNTYQILEEIVSNQY